MSLEDLPSVAQSFHGDFSFISRKLLLHNPFDHSSQRAVGLAPSPLVVVTHENNLRGNILMLVSVIICGVICCLGLHYIIRCAFKCSSSFMISEPVSSVSTPRGSANRGIKKKTLRMFPVVSYSPEINLPGLGEECIICLSDFVSGEQLRVLPKCNHGFHVRCIDMWLQQHLTCPKCRHCLVENQKISSDINQADQVAISPAESVIISIAPLEPEGRINTLRESS